MRLEKALVEKGSESKFEGRVGKVSAKKEERESLTESQTRYSCDP